MIHSAARGVPYECFVEREARIPFMATPDAVRALMEVAVAPREALSSCVFNIGAFSLSAGQIAEQVTRIFPDARIAYAPEPVRAKIVASWPEDVDDGRARAQWGWKPAYTWERTLEEYLVPALKRG
jgi:nucleoside-diphosphate-sugar epimerase